jgi:hypothetical protein
VLLVVARRRCCGLFDFEVLLVGGSQGGMHLVADGNGGEAGWLLVGW